MIQADKIAVEPFGHTDFVLDLLCGDDAFIDFLHGLHVACMMSFLTWIPPFVGSYLV